MHLAPQLINLAAHLQLDGLVAFYNLLQQGHELRLLRLQLSLKNGSHPTLTVDHLGYLLLYTSSTRHLRPLLPYITGSPYRRSRRLTPLQTCTTVMLRLHPIYRPILLLSRDRPLINSPIILADVRVARPLVLTALSRDRQSRRVVTSLLWHRLLLFDIVLIADRAC